MPEPWLDKPLQFLIALAILLGFIYWRVRVHQRPTVRRRPLWLKALVAIAETLTVLVLLLITLEGTRHLGVDVCLEFFEGHTWCNNPDSTEKPSG